MRRSRLFLPTSKEAPASAETQVSELARRAGLVHQHGSGLFAYTPVGTAVIDNLVKLLAAEMREVGFHEVSVPVLQRGDLWERSGRWEEFGSVLFSLENREGKAMCLAPTHEEAMVDLVREEARSYRNLPIRVYQVGEKFRDIHPRSGLYRTKEFLMKDAYSFHATDDDLEETYERVRDAYARVFDRLGLQYALVDTDPDVDTMGGSDSEAFIAPSNIGSDKILYCENPDCNFGTRGGDVSVCPECGSDFVLEYGNSEIAHLFRLGTHYSERLDLTYDTPEGDTREVVMGSYGVGVSRLVPVLIERYADDRGIGWPDAVAPFRYSVVPTRYDGEKREVADDLHDRAPEAMLLYDTDVTAGEMLTESDLVGVPAKAIVGDEYDETGRVEVKSRDGDSEFYDPADLGDRIADGTD